MDKKIEKKEVHTLIILFAKKFKKKITVKEIGIIRYMVKRYEYWEIINAIGKTPSVIKSPVHYARKILQPPSKNKKKELVELLHGISRNKKL